MLNKLKSKIKSYLEKRKLYSKYNHCYTYHEQTDGLAIFGMCGGKGKNKCKDKECPYNINFKYVEGKR